MNRVENPKTETTTVAMDKSMHQALKAIARRERRSVSFLIREATSRYLLKAQQAETQTAAQKQA